MITVVTVPEISSSLNTAQITLSLMENVWSESGISNHTGLTQGQESKFSFSAYIQPLCILGDLLSLEAIS